MVRVSALTQLANNGKPLANTISGSLSFALFCLSIGPPVDRSLYLTIYIIWIVSVTFMILFTCIEVVPEKRGRYMLLLLSIEIVVLTIVLAASPLDKVPKRLQDWTPLVTSLCAGAASVAFDNIYDARRHDEEAQARGREPVDS